MSNEIYAYELLNMNQVQIVKVIELPRIEYEHFKYRLLEDILFIA